MSARLAVREESLFVGFCIEEAAPLRITIRLSVYCLVAISELSDGSLKFTIAWLFRDREAVGAYMSLSVSVCL